MKIAGHTMGTPEYALDEAVRLFATLGIEGIEIIAQEGYACGISPAAGPAEVAALRRVLDESGLAPVSLIAYTNGINALEPAERRAAMGELRRVIEVASELGAPYIRVYAGALPPGSDQHAARWAALVAALQDLGRVAAPAGVTLTVENHFNTMTPSARLTALLIDEVDHPNVRILYDQANLTFQGDEEYAEAIRLQAGKIALVHVKDFVFKEEGAGFSASSVFVVSENERKVRSRVVGEGIVPWSDIVQQLAVTGYDGWLSLEYERRWHPNDLPSADVGMRRGADYLRRLLGKLRPAASVRPPALSQEPGA